MPAFSRRLRPAPPRPAAPTAHHPRAAAIAAVRGVGVPVVLAAVVTATSGWTSYTVQRGDTLTAIASRYGTTVATLVRANDLPAHGNLVFAGRPLRVPGGAGSGGDVARPGGASATHTVVSGDTLWGIARRYGTTVPALAAANGRAPGASHIVVGEVLRIRAAASPDRPDETRVTAENTFAGRTYPDDVVAAAARNREILAERDLPSREQMRDLITATARDHGVEPALALAVSWQEAGWRQDRVSVANAVGAMQVVPSTGRWVSSVIGRDLDLLDPADNVTAGVVLLRILGDQAEDAEAIAGYYQGLASVRSNGMHADTSAYVANVRALRQRFR
jgi:N-acetylmuramoyl-L-alanine amidase